MVQRRSARNFRFAWQSKILFLAPSLVGVGIFVLFPFLDMVARSFQSSVTGKVCGIKNYQAVFQNQAFLLALKNTACFVGAGLPLLIFLSLMVSLGLSRCRYQNVLKIAFLFPMAVPTATVVLIWKLLFYKNGLLNLVLGFFGGHGVDWLGSDMAFWVLIISYLWKNMGYTVVLWLAGLKHIPVSLLEAARVDGASERKIFFHVLLPGLKPVFYTVTILSLLNSFKVFREAYLVAGAYPQQRMYLLQHLFNNWFTDLELDQMSAAAVCISVVLAFIAILFRKLWDGGGKP